MVNREPVSKEGFRGRWDQFGQLQSGRHVLRIFPSLRRNKGDIELLVREIQERPEGGGFFEWMDVFSLEVLDHLGDAGFRIVELDHADRHAGCTRSLRGPIAAGSATISKRSSATSRTSKGARTPCVRIL